ncbi:hypothetical protein L226DRAFT_616190 [Lentinus tigrinus ALCF2SS1-7]|uniref:Uncharacterized protein n=1 Tax=Lentinus tigrinus ALCF2SS1-6 TaxID=1328759 RepID=A0A5C2RWB9_9APHY|nr:hypothetical protein L227DRAFT_657164 [Lentinus tigrinus ALCF2SS1-6]RPD70296.1 hypothetical protein L226DRAFT_616190 [Lentinus tigrinus ALCF2SS1-7]
MAGIIEILTTLVTGGELITKIKDVAKALIPEPAKDLKSKTRWIQCTLKNETQFDVLLQGTYFDSGRYWDAPGSFGEFSQLVFSCCNQDLEPAGVSGGTAFRLSLDTKHYYDFALGWTNPKIGSIKASVVESSNPKDAYKAAKEGGGSLTSKYVFQGKDKEGKKAQFVIHISAAPGTQTLFVLKQVEVPQAAVEAGVLASGVGIADVVVLDD